VNAPHRNRTGVIAGAFNPVTRAHIALAEAARAHVDEIVFTLPRRFPHKELTGASLEHRIEMIQRAGHRVELTDGGLFIEIARELRRSRPESEIYIVTGRDAAERVVAWDYGHPDALERMFEEFHLLVASRQGPYNPPDHLRSRIHSLEVPAEIDDISATEIRRRIASGELWEHLVPESIVDFVREVYSNLDGRQ
jgi:nicotinate-nucleotide adenylyltransferase